MLKHAHACHKVDSMVGHHIEIMSICNKVNSRTFLHVDTHNFSVR